MTANTTPFAALRIYLTIVIVVCAGILAELFDAPNALIHDRLIQLNPWPTSKAPVVWLRVSADRFDARTDWSSALDRLQQQGVEWLVFAERPAGADWSLFQRPGVSLGRRDQPCPANPAQRCLEAGPAWAPPAGVAEINAGAYRYHPLRVATQNGQRQTLAVAAVERLGRLDIPRGFNRVRVDFSRPLPTLDAARLFAGEGLHELLQGRVVIVGPEIRAPGLPAPGRTLPLSWSEYQGHVLATLLSDAGRYQPGTAATVLMTIAAALLFLLAFHFAWLRRPQIPLLLLTLAILFASWLALHLMRWLPPSSEALAAMLLALVSVLLHRARAREARMRRLAADALVELQGGWSPGDVTLSTEYWTHVSRMVAQTLNLERSIFLERIPRQARVREIKALNCSFQDIREQRRDYQRPPYTTALAEGGPIRLSRLFLQGGRPNERQYLAPLAFGGEVFGFWAMSRDEGGGDAEERRLLAHIAEFSNQIGELLYRRSRGERERLRAESPWLRLLKLEEHQDQEMEGLLERANELFRRRLRVQRAVLEGQENAFMVYDLFGRVLHYNRRMEEILRQLEFTPFDHSAVDLIARLHECSLETARDHLRHLVLEGGRLNLPIAAQDQGPTGNLSLRPLSHAEQELADGGQPFHMIGILLEITDLAEMRRILGHKRRLLERMGYQFRDQLETMSVSCYLLEKPELDDARRARVLEIMKGKIAEAIAKTRQLEELIGREEQNDTQANQPVDLAALLDEVGEEFAEVIGQRGIGLSRGGALYHRLVLADPQRLHRLLSALFTVLVNDAMGDSEIVIHTRSDEENITLALHNEGFGLPGERLRGYLFGDAADTAEEFSELREALGLLPQWGGELNVDGEVGRGIAFQLTLAVFL